MARRGSRGWKSYVPSLQTGVKVFVALIGIKVFLSVLGSTVGAQIPGSVSRWFPNV